MVDRTVYNPAYILINILLRETDDDVDGIRVSINVLRYQVPNKVNDDKPLMAYTCYSKVSTYSYDMVVLFTNERSFRELSNNNSFNNSDIIYDSYRVLNVISYIINYRTVLSIIISYVNEHHHVEVVINGNWIVKIFQSLFKVICYLDVIMGVCNFSMVPKVSNSKEGEVEV